ncbi:MAG: hypothetical protein EU530_00130 [Promethearchaeota archaeon]|nr:MAG: hypothetical protein EU530_00130 [Candidatus Lokiarchaeota archaeon]
MKKPKAFYRLFYLWILSPKWFFMDICKRFKSKRNSEQLLLVTFSFLFPLLGGTLIFTFLSRFAAVDIASKLVSKSLMWLAMVGLAYLLNFITLMLIPGFSIKYQMRQLDFGEVKVFSRIGVLRNNLYQIPIIVIFFIANITCFRQTWKIYNLGIYLATLMILTFIWVTIFQISSLSSIRTQLKEDITRKRIIPFYQFGFKAIWSTVFFTVFCIALDFLLKWWLGAIDMSLWSKLAMLLLHGN